jgi:hypothetical protein
MDKGKVQTEEVMSDEAIWLFSRVFKLEALERMEAGKDDC